MNKKKKPQQVTLWAQFTLLLYHDIKSWHLRLHILDQIINWVENVSLHHPTKMQNNSQTLKLSRSRTLIIYYSLVIPQICYCFLIWKVLKDCLFWSLAVRRWLTCFETKHYYQNIMPVSYRHCNHHCIWKRKTRKRNSASLPLSPPHTKLKPQGWQGEGREEGEKQILLKVVSIAKPPIISKQTKWLHNTNTLQDDHRNAQL